MNTYFYVAIVLILLYAWKTADENPNKNHGASGSW